MGHFDRTSCGRGLRKTVAAVVVVCFMLTGLLPAGYAQGVMDLPRPGAMVLPSAAYMPVSLRAVKVYPDQPLVFDFIVDSGDTDANQALIKTETEKLVKYFLASLTIPEKDLWVNLSPYEHDRIVPEAFGQTEMGRDLLAQDYVLKQLTASLIYPEKDLGKEFWSRVYARVTQVLGTADLPTNTFNKVWIMPDQAKVYEVGDTAILGATRMKVMMEEDYLALKQNMKDPAAGMGQMNNADIRDAARSASDVMRQVVIPEIEKEINTGKNFALLRQVYQAMVLAMWYKNNLKDSLLGQVYADKNKVDGVDILDKTDKEKIYQRYIAAYKEGVFNYIKEDVDPVTQETLPRKYFSGGFNGDHAERLVRDNTEKVTVAQLPKNIQNRVGGDHFDNVKVAITKKDNAVLVTKTASMELPAVSITSQSRPNFADTIARTLGKSLKLVSGDIKEGATYTHEGAVNVVYFNDGTSFQYEVQGSEIKLSQDPNGKVSSSIEHMLTNDSRFANTGYSQPVPLSKIQSMVTSTALSMTKTSDFDRELRVAMQHLNQDVISLPDVFILNTDKKETFGIAYLNGKLVIEKSFLDRQGSSEAFLTRSFVFALAQEDWLGKKEKEFEWINKNSPDALAKSEKIQSLLVFSKALKGEVNRDLLKDSRLSEGDRTKMNRIFDEIDQRIDRFTAGMAIAEINGEISQSAHVFFPLAADPLHFGQIEAVLRLMVTGKAVDVVKRLQGEDFRKVLTLFTASHRVEMLDKFLKKDNLSTYFSMPREYVSEVDGETQLFDYLIDHVEDTGVFEVLYLVGTDHMHFDAPDKKLDDNGYPLPKKLANQENQPDTIRKLLELFSQKLNDIKKSSDTAKQAKIEKVLQRLAEGTMKVVPMFNERSPLDSIPVSGEQEKLQQVIADGKVSSVMGLNIQGASSTAIRNALAGTGDAWALALLPRTILQEIRANDQYRGWAIKLPDMLRELSTRDATPQDKVCLDNWVVHAIENRLLTVEDVKNPAVLAGKISSMFTLSLDQIPDKIKNDPEFKVSFDLGKVTLTAAVVTDALNKLKAITAEYQDKEAVTIDPATGGIDFDPAQLNLKVERTGAGMKVTVDPAELARIKADGVSGFRPVILNITPVKSLLPS